MPEEESPTFVRPIFNKVTKRNTRCRVYHFPDGSARVEIVGCSPFVYVRSKGSSAESQKIYMPDKKSALAFAKIYVKAWGEVEQEQ